MRRRDFYRGGLIVMTNKSNIIFTTRFWATLMHKNKLTTARGSAKIIKCFAEMAERSNAAVLKST